MSKKAYLVLEDGTYFEGEGIGAEGRAEGELVFNTSMTGYQEILTDPSYAGEMITFTYPLIGNYGTNMVDWESKQVFTKGIVVKELCDRASNYRSKYSLEDFLKSNEVVGIKNVDTRTITKHLRYHGTMRAIIVNEEAELEKLIEEVKEVKSLSGQDYVDKVTTKSHYILPGGEKRVVVMDYGVKNNTLRKLQQHDCTVIVLPASASYEEIMSHQPDGVMLSNGPGDPEDVEYAIEPIKRLIENKMPIFGICMGHQLLSIALGAKTYRLKFGHRGGNHPVKNLETGKVYITSQNHGFAVDEKTIPEDVIVTHININDNTVEGIKHKKYPVMSVQYHPEAAPGPQDTAYLFEEFINIIEGK